MHGGAVTGLCFNTPLVAGSAVGLTYETSVSTALTVWPAAQPHASPPKRMSSASLQHHSAPPSRDLSAALQAHAGPSPAPSLNGTFEQGKAKYKDALQALFSVLFLFLIYPCGLSLSL